MAPLLLKFACVPAQYAPKRKLINFSLPKWRQKLAEFEADPDVQNWVNNLYQDRTFTSQSAFNRAYDEHIAGLAPSDILHWNNKPMILTTDDIGNFESDLKEGGFEDAGKVEKLARRMRDVQKAGKIVFVY